MYEFTINYSDGKTTSFTVLDYEKEDNVAYCQQGIKGGWITSYDYIYVQESW